MNYEASGASDDWAKGGAGIKFSYTIELPDTGRSGMQTRVQGNLQILFFQVQLHLAAKPDLGHSDLSQQGREGDGGRPGEGTERNIDQKTVKQNVKKFQIIIKQVTRFKRLFVTICMYHLKTSSDHQTNSIEIEEN